MYRRFIHALIIALAVVILLPEILAAQGGRGDYSAYLAELRQRESSNDYSVRNQYGFMGAYQMGEAALVDMGFVTKSGSAYDNQIADSQWTNNAKAFGVSSVESFLGSKRAQDYAINRYNEVQWRYIENLGLERYIGQEVGGIVMTESGMLAGAHLVGVGNLSKFLKSGGRTMPRD